MAKEEIGGNEGEGEHDRCLMNGDNCSWSLLEPLWPSAWLTVNENKFWRAKGEGDTGEGGKIEGDDADDAMYEVCGNMGEDEKELEGLVQLLIELLRRC